jgi:phage FluMu protein gp41
MLFYKRGDRTVNISIKRGVTSLACFVLLLLQGCTSVERIDKRSQLISALSKGRVTVLTKDGTQYELDNCHLQDSSIFGNGSVMQNSESKRFLGDLPFSSIDYIECQSFDFGKTLLAVGVSTFFVLKARSGIETGAGVSVDEAVLTYYPPRSGGGGIGSCPFIYSYDGSSYHLESETFADALCEGAERASYDILSYLKPINGELILKLTNERPETHYNNQLELLAVDAEPGTKVIADNLGNVHTISNPLSPSTAVDFSNRDVSQSVCRKDEMLWESDIASKDFSRDTDLRDGLILEFTKPVDAKTVKLVVIGGNTRLSAFAFEQLGHLLGNNALRWYQRLKQDPLERTKALSFMANAGMLHVQLWNNDRWIEQTSILDVGPVLIKEQIAVLNIDGIEGDCLRIRLESTTDLWRIDQVYVDYADDIPVDVNECSMLSARDERGNDVASKLNLDDGFYFATVTGQWADLRFSASPTKAGKHRSYIVKAKGYYHEWHESGHHSQPELLRLILRDPRLASRMYLALWREAKQKSSNTSP